MSKRHARILVAGPAALFAAALGATTALAATTWTRERPAGRRAGSVSLAQQAGG